MKISVFFLRYLVSNKSDEAAGRAALVRLRGSEDVDEELALIVAEDNISSSSGASEESVSIWDLFRRQEFRLPICITVGMHLSQQLCGIVGIFYYSTRVEIQPIFEMRLFLDSYFWASSWSTFKLAGWIWIINNFFLINFYFRQR